MNALADKLSIIIPVLNESAVLPELFSHLLPYHRRGCEIIFVDGGSQDNSDNLIKLAGFTLLSGPRGRARQMNTGAGQASGEVLLFLHADTRLPADADQIIKSALDAEHTTWGRFDVIIQGKSLLLRIVSSMMNLRSRLTGIATGDQAIFVRKSVFEQLGCFPDQPLMEDIELSRRLKRITPPVCLHQRVITSGRRWEDRGVWRTILLMWRLRLAYWMGTSPEQLVRDYR